MIDRRAIRLAEQEGAADLVRRVLDAARATGEPMGDERSPGLVLQVRPGAQTRAVVLVGELVAGAPVELVVRSILASGFGATATRLEPGEIAHRISMPTPHPRLLDVALYGPVDVARSRLQLVEEARD